MLIKAIENLSIEVRVEYAIPGIPSCGIIDNYYQLEEGEMIFPKSITSGKSIVF